MILVQVSFDAGFSVFTLLISRIYSRILRNLPVGRHIKELLSSITSVFMIDISMSFKFYYLPTFRNDFFCLSNFSLLFQECSVVNTLVGHLESRTTSAWWKGVYDLMEMWKDYGEETEEFRLLEFL